MSFPLTRYIYEKILSTKCFYSTLQFMPDGEGIETNEETSSCEIGFTKKAYLGIFLEGHSYFAEFPINLKRLQCLQDCQLETLYMATNSLLITTNEYSTIWSLHERIVGELYSRGNTSVLHEDFMFCVALSTSRLAKVNKSSSLWFWLRKLAVKLVFHDRKVNHLDFGKQIIRSLELHFANYCASFTMIWLLDVAHIFEVLDTPSILTLLRESCRQNLKDVSLWNTLASVLGGKHSQYSLVHYKQIAMQLSFLFGEQDFPIDEYLGIEAKKSDEGLIDLRWLLAVDCTVETPYRYVIHSMHNPSLALQLIKDKLLQIESPDNPTEFGKQLHDCLSSILAQIELGS